MNPSEEVKMDEQEQTAVEQASEGAVETVSGGEMEAAAVDEVSDTGVAAEAESDTEAPSADDAAPAVEAADEGEAPEVPVMNAEELLGASTEEQATEEASAEASLKALVEAVIYVTEEPLTVEQVANALDLPKEKVAAVLALLAEEYAKSDRGITIREVAGGFKMGTKPEHHEAIRNFVKRMKAPLKLSIAALETLAVIAYKQPITAPEIMEIRGVQGAGVIKTLLDRKLIAIGGRKQVVGKPILYKTTKEFLMQFGLKDLAELPTLKEFEELRRLAFADAEDGEVAAAAPAPVPAEAGAEADATAAEVAAPVEAVAPVAVEQASTEAGPGESPEPTAEVVEQENSTAASSE